MPPLRRIGKVSGGPLERILAQVRKFGDGQLAEGLDAVEAGDAAIVFEEMEEGREGHTVAEGGRVRYRLSKRYEQAEDEADIQKASIVLAHELQREPGSGDLGGETAEIVARDVGYMERLADEYGESVYRNNPEFGVLHYIKELFGEEGLKAFAETAFSHEGSYWQVEEDGGIKDDGDADVKDSKGIGMFTGEGMQGTLVAWLGLTHNEVYTHLMVPMDYKLEGRIWLNSPGISAEVIEQVRAKGVLKEEGYQKIQAARGIVAQKAAAEDIQEEAAEGLVESLEAAKKKDPVLGGVLAHCVEVYLRNNWIMKKIRMDAQMQSNRSRTEMPIAAEGAVKAGPSFVTVMDIKNFENYNEDILKFYEELRKTSQTQDYVAKYNKEAPDKPDTRCNKFLCNMIFEHFGDEVGRRIFLRERIELQNANGMCATFAGNPNLERIEVRTGNKTHTDDDLENIQKLADDGALIIVAFEVSEGIGHVAFVCPRSLTLGTARPQGASAKEYPHNDTYEGNPGQKKTGDKVSKSLLPIIVQAGTYSGITTIALGTSDWTRERDTKLGSIRFYKVKKE